MDIETNDLESSKGDAEVTNQETDQAAPKEHDTEDATMNDADNGAQVSVTSALEAALGMHSGSTEGTELVQADGLENNEDENPEWEVDSSPYESASSSSDSSDSSDDDSDDDDDHPILGLEETARLLMAADDNDGDGDGPNRSGKPAAPLRTKNEIIDDAPPKPDVTITPEMKIELLGHIEFIVDRTIVVKSKTAGEVSVLNSGTVLCKEDRAVVGALADVIGAVRDPKYTVGFSKEEEIKELGLEIGTPIFYSVEHADYVFTQALKEMKGTDASNLHDEEVAPEEMEFSDDEKEAEAKKALKLKKRGAKATRGGRDGHPNPMSLADTVAHALNYDEDEDGPYRPLTRPQLLPQGGPSSLPPRPDTGRGGYNHRGSQRGGRGDARGGRGQRGARRGGGRDGPRGGHGGSASYSNTQGQHQAFQMPQGPPAPPQNPHLPPPPFGAIPPPPVGHWTPGIPVPFPPPPQYHAQAQAHGAHVPPPPPFNFNYQGWNSTNQQAAPAHPQPTGYPQGAYASAPQPPTAGGAYANPAFFQGANRNQQGQAQQPQHQQYWNQQQGGYGQGPN